MNAVATRLVFRFLALLLAVNYLFFRVELSEEEYTANHPPHTNEVSFTDSSVNWETFDKSNAPKAIVVNPLFILSLIHQIPAQRYSAAAPLVRQHPVRDKSPPVPSIHTDLL